MLLNALLKPIEGLLNRYLALDEEQSALLWPYQYKILQIELLPMHTTFFIRIEDCQVRLDKPSAGPADAVLRTTPLAALQLLTSNGTSLPPNVTITGDLTFAQTLRAVFTQMDIDWEEQLSNYVGDTLAYALGRRFRRLKDYQQHAKHSFVRSSTEYLQEELRLFPPRAELSDFFDAVDNLRDDVARLATRITHLIQSPS